MFFNIFKKEKKKKEVYCGDCINLSNCEVRRLINEAHQYNPSKFCFKASITYCEDFQKREKDWWYNEN